MRQQPTEAEIWESMVCAYEKSLEHAKHKLAEAQAKENKLSCNVQLIQYNKSQSEV